MEAKKESDRTSELCTGIQSMETALGLEGVPNRCLVAIISSVLFCLCHGTEIGVSSSNWGWFLQLFVAFGKWPAMYATLLTTRNEHLWSIVWYSTQRKHFLAVAFLKWPVGKVTIFCYDPGVHKADRWLYISGCLRVNWGQLLCNAHCYKLQ